jgi:hypothetical protein
MRRVVEIGQRGLVLCLSEVRAGLPAATLT